MFTAIIVISLLAAASLCLGLNLSGGDYIPNKDADVDAWATNFDTVITAAPADYGLTAPQAGAFNILRTAYTAALLASTNPGTRTPVTVAAKDAAKNAMLAIGRELAMIARRYPAITDELLAAAGLTVPDVVPSPIPAPTSSPVLSLLSATPLQHTLRFKDSVLANPRSKPQGVQSMLLFAKTGAVAPTSIADCDFIGIFTRTPAVVNWPGASAGLAAHYLAVWVNPRGEQGPTSAALAATIMAA